MKNANVRVLVIVFALIVLVAGCSVGIVILVRTYLKIEKKYKKTGI